MTCDRQEMSELMQSVLDLEDCTQAEIRQLAAEMGITATHSKTMDELKQMMRERGLTA